MDPAKPTGDSGPQKIEGWKAIANYFGRTPRAVQLWEQEGRLKVHRFNGRVWALVSDLEDFAARSPSLRDPESLDAKVDSTEVAVTTELSTARPVRPLTGRMGVLFAACSLLAVMFGITWLTATKEIAGYRLQVSTLIATDAKGTDLWSYQFPTPFSHSAYDESYREARSAIADIDGDGKNELLYAYYGDDGGTAGLILYCFSPDGRPLWQFRPDGPPTKDRLDNPDYSPPYYINTVRVAKLSKGARVLVSSNHNMSGANQIASLDSRGRMLNEYWHPGHLLTMQLHDLDGDGKEELLVAGVNNSQHAATLLVFDPASIRGAPAYVPGSHYRWDEVGPGSQKAELLFPRTDVGLKEPFNRVRALNVLNNRLYVHVAEGTDADSDPNITYELDLYLNPLAVAPGVEYQTAHRSMKRFGELDHDLSNDEMERWKRSVTNLNTPLIP